MEEQHSITCNCQVCLRMWESRYAYIKKQATKREEMAAVVPWWRWRKHKKKAKVNK